MSHQPAQPSTGGSIPTPDAEGAFINPSSGRGRWWAAGSLLFGWAYLWLLIEPSLRWAGVQSPLPWAAWLLPVCAAVAPWVLTGFGNRGRRAVVGQLGALLAVGAMMFSPVLGALLGLLWILGVQIAARFAPRD